jgi:hypothetical protein
MIPTFPTTAHETCRTPAPLMIGVPATVLFWLVLQAKEAEEDQ